MMLFAEQLVDGFYLPVVFMATLLRPFNIMWLKHTINEKYDFQKDMIIRYFAKCLFDTILWIPLSVVLTIVMITYCPKNIFILAKGYLIIFRHQNLLQSINSESVIKKYTFALWNKLIKDLPHLPLFTVMNLSLFHLFDKNL